MTFFARIPNHQSLDLTDPNRTRTAAVIALCALRDARPDNADVSVTGVELAGILNVNVNHLRDRIIKQWGTGNDPTPVISVGHGRYRVPTGEDYIAMPAWSVLSARDPSTIVVFAAICARLNRGNRSAEVEMSLDQIAELVTASRKTIIAAIHSLERMGALIVKRTLRFMNRYRINWTPSEGPAKPTRIQKRGQQPKHPLREITDKPPKARVAGTAKARVGGTAKRAAQPLDPRVTDTPFREVDIFPPLAPQLSDDVKMVLDAMGEEFNDNLDRPSTRQTVRDLLDAGWTPPELLGALMRWELPDEVKSAIGLFKYRLKQLKGEAPPQPIDLNTDSVVIVDSPEAVAHSGLDSVVIDRSPEDIAKTKNFIADARRGLHAGEASPATLQLPDLGIGSVVIDRSPEDIAKTKNFIADARRRLREPVASGC